MTVIAYIVADIGEARTWRLIRPANYCMITPENHAHTVDPLVCIYGVGSIETGDLVALLRDSTFFASNGSSHGIFCLIYRFFVTP